MPIEHTFFYPRRAPYAASAAAIWLAVLCGSLPALAETVPQASQAARPKVGLVLGGGGARGSAHVGVLKVLEALHVPIDYIAGNSMGAIVGGLYASGFTPGEIEHELKTIDWDDTFDDKPPRAERSYHRKLDDELYLVKPRLGFSDGEVKTPLAYIQGQKFDLQLSRLTLRAAHIHDFNKLPIPFRAVATDLETGREVVLQSGELARAIRASMAVPGGFDPVEIDGRLLVDGLVANNVPVNVARAMGADVLIVVDVGSGLYARNQIKGVVDVVAQLTNILSERNVELQLATLEPHDILIKPQLDNLGSGDFNRAGEGVAMGEQAARDIWPTLQRLSVAPARYAQIMARRTQPARAPLIGFVRLDNQSHIGDETILSRITLKPGQRLDSAKMDTEIGEIYGLDVFESVRYEVVQENGQTGVLLHAKEKSWGPNYLQFGIELENNYQDNNTYNLGVLYTRTAMNALNGEVRLGLQVGQSPSVFTEWHQPLDSNSRYFINTRFAVSNNQYSLYDGFNVTDDYAIWSAGMDLAGGREFGTWGEGRIGYRRGSGRIDTDSSAASLQDGDFQLGQFYARLALDKLDNIFFPSSGNKAKLELVTAGQPLGSDISYEQALLSYTYATTWGRHSLVGSLVLDTTLNSDAPVEALFRTGGFLQFSGYGSNQLSGQHVGRASLAFYRRIVDAKILPAYLGVSIEYGNVWQDGSDVSFDNMMLNGSLFLGADTPIGPLYMGVGLGEGGRVQTFLLLGPAF